MQFSLVNRSALNPELRLDAEYYRPDNVALDAKVRALPHRDLGSFSKFIAGPFGSTVTTKNYVVGGPYRYIRGKDVQRFEIEDDDPVAISRELFERLSQFHLQAGDLLVTVVGAQFGKAALVLDNDLPAIFSCKSSLIRDFERNAFFLNAFLASKYGYTLIRRGQRGAAQPGINLSDLRTIPVPVFDASLENAIEIVLRQASTQARESKALHAETERELMSYLNLADWTPPRELSFIGSIANVRGKGRFDAEHFQPKYKALFERLPSDIELVPLKRCVSIQRGVEVGSVEYKENGVPFWRVSNLSKRGLVHQGLMHISQEKFLELRGIAEAHTGELLLSKDGTPGIAYYLDFEPQGLISGGLLRLKRTVEIPGRYLELALNSELVQMQAEQDAGGSVITHWKPREIGKTLIPRLGAREQLLADKVQRAHDLQRSSEHLRNRASRSVEIAIDESAEIAKAWLAREGSTI